MSKDVMVSLPDEVYRRIESLAQITGRNVCDVLADAIALSLPPLDDSGTKRRPVAELSDREVVDLTGSNCRPRKTNA